MRFSRRLPLLSMISAALLAFAPGVASAARAIADTNGGGFGGFGQKSSICELAINGNSIKSKVPAMCLHVETEVSFATGPSELRAVSLSVLAEGGPAGIAAVLGNVPDLSNDQLYEVDTTTARATSMGVDLESLSVVGATFDHAGVLWVLGSRPNVNGAGGEVVLTRIVSQANAAGGGAGAGGVGGAGGASGAGGGSVPARTWAIANSVVLDVDPGNLSQMTTALNDGDVAVLADGTLFVVVSVYREIAGPGQLGQENLFFRVCGGVAAAVPLAAGTDFLPQLDGLAVLDESVIAPTLLLTSVEGSPQSYRATLTDTEIGNFKPFTVDLTDAMFAIDVSSLPLTRDTDADGLGDAREQACLSLKTYGANQVVADYLDPDVDRDCVLDGAQKELASVPGDADRCVAPGSSIDGKNDGFVCAKVGSCVPGCRLAGSLDLFPDSGCPGLQTCEAIDATTGLGTCTEPPVAGGAGGAAGAGGVAGAAGDSGQGGGGEAGAGAAGEGGQSGAGGGGAGESGQGGSPAGQGGGQGGGGSPAGQGGGGQSGQGGNPALGQAGGGAGGDRSGVGLGTGAANGSGNGYVGVGSAEYEAYSGNGFEGGGACSTGPSRRGANDAGWVALAGLVGLWSKRRAARVRALPPPLENETVAPHAPSSFAPRRFRVVAVFVVCFRRVGDRLDGRRESGNVLVQNRRQQGAGLLDVARPGRQRRCRGEHHPRGHRRARAGGARRAREGRRALWRGQGHRRYRHTPLSNRRRARGDAR